MNFKKLLIVIFYMLYIQIFVESIDNPKELQEITRVRIEKLNPPPDAMRVYDEFTGSD